MLAFSAMGTSRRKEDGPETGGDDPRLARQQSLLSLTLDEYQSAERGPRKSLGSMNMDEFLTNIWSTEEGSEHAQVPPPASGRTGEEVLSVIQWQPPEAQPLAVMSTSLRQPTLGEMTLEDFLVKAGVVREGARGTGGHLLPRSPAMPVKQSLQQQQQEAFGWAARTGNGTGRIELPASPDSSESLDRPSWGRKRGLDGPVEKVVERRQRRMMKNRESAARSRARKQVSLVQRSSPAHSRKQNLRAEAVCSCSSPPCRPTLWSWRKS